MVSVAELLDVVDVKLFVAALPEFFPVTLETFRERAPAMATHARWRLFVSKFLFSFFQDSGPPGPPRGLKVQHNKSPIFHTHFGTIYFSKNTLYHKLNVDQLFLVKRHVRSARRPHLDVVKTRMRTELSQSLR